MAKNKQQRQAASGTDNLKALAEAFEKLTYRETMTLADVLAETLQAVNGLNVKAEVFAEVLDSFGAYLAIELQTGD